MIAVDTNVLVYAHREESEHHREALDRLTSLAQGRELWGLPVFCLGEFVRVVTHPRLFDEPSTLEQALSVVNALRGSPSFRVLLPRERYWALFSECLAAADARGNLAFDAQIAAVCLENGVGRLVTLDRDFRRFAQIEVVGLG